MKEIKFQNKTLNRIKEMLPGCIILRTDPGYIQGIPDVIILHGERWAALEFKASEYANRQPNQQYYVTAMSDMSYASFIYPDIEEEVLYELQRALLP